MRHQPSPQHGDQPPISRALHAQALWDATMAESIAEALRRHPGALVLHFAGSFHVERGTGIMEPLRLYQPSARVVTVVIQRAPDIDRFEPGDHTGLGDFVILTPRAGASAGR